MPGSRLKIDILCFLNIGLCERVCTAFSLSPFSEWRPSWSFLLVFSFSFLPSNGSLSSVARFSQLSNQKRKEVKLISPGA